MSSRQSRQAKHTQAKQSIQKIFTDYDDKIQMRSASPQPTSPYPSARFAIHRNKSPNNRRTINKPHNHYNGSPVVRDNNSPHTTQINTSALRQQSLNVNGNNSPSTQLQVKPLKKAKSLNSTDIQSPVTSIGSMFDNHKKSSIADLHKNNLLERDNNKKKSLFSDDANDESIAHINIPHYNTQSLFNKFEQETTKINEVFTNYQQSFSTIIREQSICITQLLNELDKKNNQIRTLKDALKKQHQHQHSHGRPPTPNQNQIQVQSHNNHQQHVYNNNNHKQQPQHPLNGNGNINRHHINRTFNHQQNR
mmetsp:Transcript_22221/g.19546  ORF Transcript_22221/g.19546 Transcript_22221/m.19546 type:complete len:307 (+) Transcript_22221:67-987(+)